MPAHKNVPISWGVYPMVISRLQVNHTVKKSSLWATMENLMTYESCHTFSLTDNKSIANTLLSVGQSSMQKNNNHLHLSWKGHAFLIIYKTCQYGMHISKPWKQFKLLLSLFYNDNNNKKKNHTERSRDHFLKSWQKNWNF